MAPLNGSAKSRKPGGSKTSQARKTVIPAIPLPYVKRQAAAASAASVASGASSPASTVAAAAPTSATSARVPPGFKAANGTPQKASHTSKPSDSAPSESSSVRPDDGIQHTGVAAGPNIPDSSDVAASGSEQASTVDELEEASKSSKATTDHADQPIKLPNDDTRAQVPSNGSQPIVSTVKANGAAENIESNPATDHVYSGDARPDLDSPTASDHPRVKASAKPRQPTSMSPSRYQLPPPFQPTNRAVNMASNGDVSRNHRPHLYNGPHIHQPHPSNGSVHFGAFHGSASSSPAPPISGGIAPPPGMPLPDGRPPYMNPAANGYPPMMPYGADMAPVTTFDNYGRPTMAYGPMDSYAPYGNNFGLGGQPNFHDARSGHLEENNMHSYHPARPQGGAPESVDENRTNPSDRLFPGPEYPGMMNKPVLPPHMLPPGDNTDDLVVYLRQQFGSVEYSDCVLELRCMNRGVLPVHIPGHRIIFARSGELARLLRAASRRSTNQQSIVLETNNKWILSESFYIAVQRLYGLPLFEIPPPPPGIEQGENADIGSISRRFDFVLSYAAAGHILEWDSIVRRGCEMAIQLLNWQTLERALEFALEDYSDQGSHDTYKYGDGSRAIVRGVVAFIVNNLPPNFVVDNTVPGPESWARLPSAPSPPPSPTVDKVSSPVARGSTVRLGRGRKSQQITGIQFGDLSLGDDSVSEAPEVPSQAPQSHQTLSRILLNLPFTHLREILEVPGPSTLNGQPYADEIVRVGKDAVAAREKCRSRVLSSVKAGLIGNSQALLTQLASPEPRYFNQWTMLGWHEEVFPFSHGDGPVFGRKWIPLVPSGNQQTEAVAAYP